MYRNGGVYFLVLEVVDFSWFFVLWSVNWGRGDGVVEIVWICCVILFICLFIFLFCFVFCVLVVVFMWWCCERCLVCVFVCNLWGFVFWIGFIGFSFWVYWCYWYVNMFCFLNFFCVIEIIEIFLDLEYGCLDLSKCWVRLIICYGFRLNDNCWLEYCFFWVLLEWLLYFFIYIRFIVELFIWW